LSDGAGSNAIAVCMHASNFQTSNNIHDYKIDHNTCAMGASGSFGVSGFDVTLDGTDQTSDGSTGAYFSNRTVTNNIGPAGGLVTYK